jgi:hypothetical protein
MCNSVEVVKKYVGLTHCPHLPDLLSDRQERDFDSSALNDISFMIMTSRLRPTYFFTTSTELHIY